MSDRCVMLRDFTLTFRLCNVHCQPTQWKITVVQLSVPTAPRAAWPPSSGLQSGVKQILARMHSLHLQRKSWPWLQELGIFCARQHKQGPRPCACVVVLQQHARMLVALVPRRHRRRLCDSRQRRPLASWLYAAAFFKAGCHAASPRMQTCLCHALHRS